MVALALMAPLLFGAGPPSPSTPPASFAEVLKEMRRIESAALRGEAEALRQAYQDRAKASLADKLSRIFAAWCIFPSEQSWSELKAVAMMSPENPWVHYGMGRIYVRWRIWDQAESAFRTASAAAKDFYPALVGQGELARARERFPEAEAAYREALKLADDAEAHAGLGLVLLAQGKKAEAGPELSRAIELWPDQPEVLRAQGQLAREAKDTRAALQHMERLAELAPKDRAARRAAGDLLYEAGEKALAARHYEALLRLGERDVEVLQRLVEIYSALGDTAALTRALTELSGRDRSDPGPLLRLADLAEAGEHLEEAEGYLRDALDRAPGRADAWLELARLLSRVQRPREAFEAYREAALRGDSSEERRREQEALAQAMKLPKSPASGDVDRIYRKVSSSLFALYAERKAAQPGLHGSLKLRVRVGADGRASDVEVIEDTVEDPLLAGHVYFALKDAVFPKQKREPIFEFVLEPSSR